MCQLQTLLTRRLYAIITCQLYLLEFMSKIEVDGCDVVQEDQGMLHHRFLRTLHRHCWRESNLSPIDALGIDWAPSAIVVQVQDRLLLRKFVL